VRDGLVAVRRASAALHEIVDNLDDTAMHGSSRLEGWSRGHVVSHLARNADGLCNLLGWARTGIERPMYASHADREADIEEGSHRLAQVQHEDLRAADERFMQAADALSGADWDAEVTGRQGKPLPVSLVPWMRLTEVLVHQVDLNLGMDFDGVVEMAGEQAEPLVDYVVTRFSYRGEIPAMRLAIELPSGDERTWTVGRGDEPREIRGPAAPALAWLTGRNANNGGALVGDTPKLPAWL
jgi:maleylpyruvate isomerase